MKDNDLLKIQNWYPRFSAQTFPTSFVWLRPEAIARLAEGADAAPDRIRNTVDRQVISDLRAPMSAIPGNCFAGTDLYAPTDTGRFASKRGAVHSPESAWYYLRQSKKIAVAAKNGDVNCIALRPFRRMTIFREFRLFIREGELAGASQYHLVRYFNRLERQKKEFWELAQRFVEENAWRLPVPTVAADIYFTSDNEILLLDLNPWGGDTDPLLLRSWERDWDEEPRLVTMDPPTTIHGGVDVSF